MFQAHFKTYLVFFLLLLFPILSSLNSQDALSEISLGKEELNRKNFKKSIIHFQHAIRLNPNSLEARIGYAKSAQELGSLQDAKLAYDEVLKRSPGKTEAVIGLIEIFLSIGELDKIPPLLTPALEQSPNNTGLRISEAKYLAATDKFETAIVKLKRVSLKLNFPPDVERMLAELYLSHGLMKEAETSLELYTSKEPNDPYGFYLKAKLHLNRSFFSIPDLNQSYALAEENLVNALQLDDKHEGSRFLLAKIRYMQNEWESAFQILYELSKEFPENQNYHFWEAFLSKEIGKTKFSSFHFKKSLLQNDLDEIARFTAEDYAISNEKEEAKLRFYLGSYRKERFEAEKNSLYFKSALFHLFRAKDLIPGSPAVRKDLLESFFQRGELVSHLNLLLQMREEDPTNFKLQTLIDADLKSLTESLEYKEGYLDINKEAATLQQTSVQPEVFVYDFEPLVVFPEKSQAGKTLSQALRYHLTKIQNVRIPSNSEYKSITETLAQSQFHPYTKSVPFSLEGLPALDKERRNKPRIRFVVFGTYALEKESITIHWQLYDRNLAKVIIQGKTMEKGRDGLTAIISRISEKIKNSLPNEGRALRIKKEGVLVSLGKRDGLKKGGKVVFARKDVVLGEAEIVEIGKEMSLVSPKFRDWEKELATGELCFIPPKAEANDSNPSK